MVGCLLRVDCCWIDVACSSLCDICCLMDDACFCCVLDVCCLVFVVGWSLFVDCSALLIARYVLPLV